MATRAWRGRAGVAGDGERIRTLERELARKEKALAKAAALYVILDSGSAGEFMQALWTPAGFLMEFQEGGVANHFQTIRRDLSLAEVAAALEEYAKGNESTWRSAFLFKRIDPRPSAYLGGIRVGRLVRAWWPLLAATMFVIVMMSLKLWGCA